MPPTLAPTPTSSAGSVPSELCARVAVYASPDEPPAIIPVHADEAIEAIEGLCEVVERHSTLPAPAVREIVENLVHAGFADAVVSIFDGGHTVRVSDHGPGIADPERALQPGFSSAGPAERRVVRGVGGGLPLAQSMIAAAGGSLEIGDNLGGGATVTLTLPSAPAGDEAAAPCSETARMIMALLLEIGAARAERLARELGRDRGECGRELALLQYRGHVARDADGAHSLTQTGSALLATLF
jgi:hypothetical protein